MTSDERALRGLDVRAPDGELLEAGQRLTFREARAWVRRDSTLLDVGGSAPVVWAEDDDRPEVVARFRRSEGKDCNTAGDVVLFRLPDGRRAAVIEER